MIWDTQPQRPLTVSIIWLMQRIKWSNIYNIHDVLILKNMLSTFNNGWWASSLWIPISNKKYSWFSLGFIRNTSKTFCEYRSNWGTKMWNDFLLRRYKTSERFPALYYRAWRTAFWEVTPPTKVHLGCFQLVKIFLNLYFPNSVWTGKIQKNVLIPVSKKFKNVIFSGCEMMIKCSFLFVWFIPSYQQWMR